MWMRWHDAAWAWPIVLSVIAIGLVVLTTPLMRNQEAMRRWPMLLGPPLLLIGSITEYDGWWLFHDFEMIVVLLAAIVLALRGIATFVGPFRWGLIALSFPMVGIVALIVFGYFFGVLLLLFCIWPTWSYVVLAAVRASEAA